MFTRGAHWGGPVRADAPTEIFYDPFCLKIWKFYDVLYLDIVSFYYLLSVK